MIISIASWAANRLESLAYRLRDFVDSRTTDLEIPYPEGPQGDE